jgi:site-specific DNA recombinase
LCRGICAQQGFAIAYTYSDRAVSGTGTINRFGWQQLMRDAKAGRFDVVVAEALDRCFRSEADYHAARRQLDFLGIAIHTGQGNVAKLDGSLRAMMAAHFSADLADKVRRGQQGAVQRGQHIGPPPYECVLLPPTEVKGSNQIVIDDNKAKVVREIFAAYLADGYPRTIAAMLNERGEPGPRGGVWNASAIAGSRTRANGILRNALYAGRIVHNLAVYADVFEWVEMPNTLGMAVFANGGQIASKPYVASGAYIDRMSDFCAGCTYDVRQKNGPNAWPFRNCSERCLRRHKTKKGHHVL